ncbi:aminotransferase-like domain-containing protein [Paraburkholderia megapolitana]|uniref:aminotransferase-like domain-containing protein n=1 Tax=Paraburkholderia megapolitana TaxID=420953 RepID=UPI0038BA134E
MSATAQPDVMNFLNEVSSRFPAAISLAAGRPTEQFFDRLHPGALLDALTRYEQHALRSADAAAVRTRLLQYGRTAGMIEEQIAAQLRIDQDVPAQADRLLVTAGCQEALALCLPALCPDPTDVLLVCNPTYIGATGVAAANRIALHGLPEGDVAQAVEQSVAQLQREGRHARALYLIPDFDNPTGRVLDEAQRRAILAVCARHRIVVLEDNAYGLFRYDGVAVPPMAALDEAGSVIYLSTFSKTLSPAFRVGAAVLPDTLFGDRAARHALWENLVQRKSYVTVNTSPLTQAIVGGLLLAEGGSLRNWIQPMAGWYRTNRDTMLDALQSTFAPLSDAIGWNRPAGGFFLSMDLPFEFDAQAVTDCATRYGVIVMPMSFFALDASQNRRIRLAFSAMTPPQIRAGVAALGGYVAQRLEQCSKSAMHAFAEAR